MECKQTVTMCCGCWLICSNIRNTLNFIGPFDTCLLVIITNNCLYSTKLNGTIQYLSCGVVVISPNSCVHFQDIINKIKYDSSVEIYHLCFAGVA